MNAKRRRLALPLLAVPPLFGVMLPVASGENPQLLGVLAVTAVIWMGASLSLTSIAAERECFEHERRLFLRPSAYILAKTLVIGTVGDFHRTSHSVHGDALVDAIPCKQRSHVVPDIDFLQPRDCALPGRGVGGGAGDCAFRQSSRGMFRLPTSFCHC